MRKASKILCKIGGFFGILLAITWFVLAICYFVFAGFATALKAGEDIPQAASEFLQKWVYAHDIHSFDALITSLVGEGILYVIMMLFAIASAVVSFIVAKKEKTGLPLPIVLAVLSWAGNVPAFVGAALAIVNWAIVERKEDQPQEAQQAEEPKDEE